MATLLEFRCESVILLGSDLPQQALEQLAATIPVILVGRRAALSNLDVIRTADGRGQGLLIDHLVKLGHRSIAHVDGGSGMISADRRRGYRSAMRSWNRARLSQSALRSATGGPPIMPPIRICISPSVGAEVRLGSSMVLKQ